MSDGTLITAVQQRDGIKKTLESVAAFASAGIGAAKPQNFLTVIRDLSRAALGVEGETDRLPAIMAERAELIATVRRLQEELFGAQKKAAEKIRELQEQRYAHSATLEQRNRFHGAYEKAERFKAYVHARLDGVGVPHDPDPEHNAKHGCRIEGRLNFLFKKLEEETKRHYEWMDACTKARAQLEASEKAAAEGRIALALAAPHHQGGHSVVGRAIANALSLNAGADYVHKSEVEKAQEQLRELRHQHQAALGFSCCKKAVAEEREACLRVIEDRAHALEMWVDNPIMETKATEIRGLAAAIRRRGQKVEGK